MREKGGSVPVEFIDTMPLIRPHIRMNWPSPNLPTRKTGRSLLAFK
jgi:hypothetical protein